MCVTGPYRVPNYRKIWLPQVTARYRRDLPRVLNPLVDMTRPLWYPHTFGAREDHLARRGRTTAPRRDGASGDRGDQVDRDTKQVLSEVDERAQGTCQG